MLPLDHVTVAGAELRRMQDALAAIGIDSVYGGAHSDGATGIIAVHPDAAPRAAESHPWARFMTGNAGPCTWAVCTSDLAAEVSRQRAAGVAVSGPFSNGRLRPDGIPLAWQIASARAGPAGSFFPFLIQDFTPRELRAFPHGAQRNRDFPGISRVVLGVRSLDASIARYRQSYGLTNAITRSDAAWGAELAFLDDAPIVLAQPLEPHSWLAARLEQFGEAPCAVLLKPADPTRCDLRIGWFDRQTLGWRLGWCC